MLEEWEVAADTKRVMPSMRKKNLFHESLSVSRNHSRLCTNGGFSPLLRRFWKKGNKVNDNGKRFIENNKIIHYATLTGKK